MALSLSIRSPGSTQPHLFAQSLTAQLRAHRSRSGHDDGAITRGYGDGTSPDAATACMAQLADRASTTLLYPGAPPGIFRPGLASSNLGVNARRFGAPGTEMGEGPINVYDTPARSR